MQSVTNVKICLHYVIQDEENNDEISDMQIEMRGKFKKRLLTKTSSYRTEILDNDGI